MPGIDEVRNEGPHRAAGMQEYLHRRLILDECEEPLVARLDQITIGVR